MDLNLFHLPLCCRIIFCVSLRTIKCITLYIRDRTLKRYKLMKIEGKMKTDVLDLSYG